MWYAVCEACGNFIRDAYGWCAECSAKGSVTCGHFACMVPSEELMQARFVYLGDGIPEGRCCECDETRGFGR